METLGFEDSYLLSLVQRRWYQYWASWHPVPQNKTYQGEMSRKLYPMKADEILKSLGITIRLAEHSDSNNIWAWRNDSKTRRNSNSEDEVTWENHCAWFDKSLLNENRRMLIGINADSSDAIGVVRFDLDTDGNSAEVFINLNPKFRGKGLSKLLLSSAIDTYSKEYVGVLRAEIKLFNIPSIECFEHCGFTAYERDEKHIRLRRY